MQWFPRLPNSFLPSTESAEAIFSIRIIDNRNKQGISCYLSAVRGTTSANNSKIMRPSFLPPMLISKKLDHTVRPSMPPMLIGYCYHLGLSFLSAMVSGYGNRVATGNTGVDNFAGNRRKLPEISLAARGGIVKSSLATRFDRHVTRIPTISLLE